MRVPKIEERKLYKLSILHLKEDWRNPYNLRSSSIPYHQRTTIVPPTECEAYSEA